MADINQFRNKPLVGPWKHPFTGEWVRVGQALVDPFTPTGIFPNRQQRRQMMKMRIKINNRKRTRGRGQMFQEVFLPIENLEQYKTDNKVRTTTLRHYINRERF